MRSENTLYCRGGEMKNINAEEQRFIIHEHIPPPALFVLNHNLWARNVFIITSKANQSQQENTKQANKQVISNVNLCVIISYETLIIKWKVFTK